MVKIAVIIATDRNAWCHELVLGMYTSEGAGVNVHVECPRVNDRPG
jgi:hypothetical protein